MSGTLKGKILDIDANGIATVSVQINIDEYVKKGFVDVWVMPIDSRKISDKQRRACWALIGEIAEFVGQDKEGLNYDLKFDFMQWRAEKMGENLETFFSLSSAPMDLVAEYQKYLISFILRYDIPTTFSLLGFIDGLDTQDYIYQCLINKKCCICGKRAELHHCDRVGMGRNRDEILHIGMKCLPLCREHHQETENTPATEFFDKYHIDDGVPIDETIKKIYKLKSKAVVK